MSDGQCHGNCKLFDPDGYCTWAQEFVKSGGKLPDALGWHDGGDDESMDEHEGTDCQTWQKKEG